MKFKKMLTLAAIGLSGFGLVACGNQSAASKQSASGTIEVISRENGSGTRVPSQKSQDSQKRR